jgi:hypothetical protein
MDQELEAAEKAIAQAPEQEARKPETEEPGDEQQEEGFEFVSDFWAIIDVAPDGAVLGAYARLSRLLTTWAAVVLDEGDVQRQTVTAIVHKAAKAERMSEQLQSALRSLTTLRNQVAHGRYEASSEDAAEFLSVVEDVALVLFSQLRHPSQAQAYLDFLQRAERDEP